MNKFKLFIENFVIYGLGGIISKAIPLIMVPVITKIMPSSDYYGVSDLANTIVQFGSALAVMGMYDAMYRLFFEKDDIDYKKTVCSTALLVTISTSVIVFIAMIVFKDNISKLFFNDRKYANLVYLSAMATLLGATNSIVSAPIRMQNKRKIYIIANTIGPLISYSIAVPLLLAGHYLIALPLAAVISAFSMECTFIFINREWFSYKKINVELIKPLLKIAIPLLPNFLIYWIFNSCDKVMIANFIGTNASGVYSVSSKLGQCSQLVYTAFAGGWQYFAFSTMKEKNQVESNSKIFEYLGVVSFAVSAIVFTCSFSIFKILFSEEYLEGYVAAPYLFLAPLLQMLFQVSANQFLIIKKTWPSMFILLSGAAINIILNIILIPVLGIEGASIATVLGYVVANLVCVLVLLRMKLMTISLKFIFVVVFFIVYIMMWRFLFKTNLICALVASFLFITFLVILYYRDIRLIFDSK